MKPLGQKTYKGSECKVDYHMRENGKRLKNWWEDVSTPQGKGKLNICLENEICQGIEEFDFQRQEDLEDYNKLIMNGINDL